MLDKTCLHILFHIHMLYSMKGNDELEITWKQEVVVYFKAVSRSCYYS